MSAYTHEIATNLKEIGAFLIAAVGGGFALWRWTVDQKWRRVQYARSLIKSFFDDDNVAKACEVIDCDETVKFEDENNPEQFHEVETSDDFLIKAFSIFLKKRSGEGVTSDSASSANRKFHADIVRKDTNTANENDIRWVFDDFFAGLSDFQSDIEAGLIKLEDISPYLEYFLKELSGKGNIRGKRLSRQLHAYLTYFGFRRVLELARNMGYPFEESWQ